ncbi:MAG: hypothetical protein ACYDA8_16420 [Deferrisomatales bacterium]
MSILDFLKRGARNRPPEPEPPREPDFDQLSQEARQSGSRAAMDRLWGAVYDLPHWHMVARGEGADVHPFIGIVEGKPFVMAFTDEDRAAGFARAQGFANAEGRVRILCLPIPTFLEAVPFYEEQGVFGMLFNSGEHGFFAPLGNAVPMQRYFEERHNN